MLLRHRSDLRTLAFLALYFVALGWAWSLPSLSLWGRSGVLPAVAAFALMAWMSWIAAVVAHNVVHVPMWRSPFLNRVTRIVVSVAYGFAINEYVPGHNLSHHRYTQQRRDVMRTSKVRFAWNLANLLMFFPVVARDVLAANARYVRVARASRPRWYRERCVQLAVTWGLTAALLVLDWRKALLLFVLPHVGAAWGITTVNFLWHDGCDAEHPHHHSRNFVGKIFNFVHFNNGFHGIHHMEPGLHWSLLPERHAEVLGPFLHPALAQRSLAAYLLRTFVLEPRRLRYDGRPVEPIEEGPDEDWIGSTT
jgi:fatty acid desaturase